MYVSSTDVKSHTAKERESRREGESESGAGIKNQMRELLVSQLLSLCVCVCVVTVVQKPR